MQRRSGRALSLTDEFADATAASSLWAGMNDQLNGNLGAERDRAHGICLAALMTHDPIQTWAARMTSGTTHGKKIPQSWMLPRDLKGSFKRRSTSCGCTSRRLPVSPCLRQAVLGLDLAFELFPVSIDLRELIVSEFALLLFHLAGKLLPVSFDGIPIHVASPLVRGKLQMFNVGRS